MHIIIFTHPHFQQHQSMPRFAAMLQTGMIQRGHTVEMWAPEAFFSRLAINSFLKKWMGYIDQYLIFPVMIHNRLKKFSSDTLFVFADQALGPWVPLVANRPHIIHCHDFLAQRSALGQVAENPVAWFGRQYQAYIKRGYLKGKNFISVSHKTRDDLHHFLDKEPKLSEVVYNGLNSLFEPYDVSKARFELSEKTGIALAEGYILHVGGNQWYKNREGVIEIYSAWRDKSEKKVPLLLIGYQPSAILLQKARQSLYMNDIHFLSNLNEDRYVHMAYAGALIFLFPSLAEGFGWPIAEAMASGCPVITTNEAPMTEVADKAGFMIPKRPPVKDAHQWAIESAAMVEQVLNLEPLMHDAAIDAGIANAKRFNSNHTVDGIELIYKKVLDNQNK